MVDRGRAREGCFNPGVYGHCSIDWGDGQTGAGVVAAGAAAGQFVVNGSHSYSDNSQHTITVTVAHGSGQPLAVTSIESGLTINALGNFALLEDIYVVGSGTVNVSAGNGVLARRTKSSSKRSRTCRNTAQTRPLRPTRKRCGCPTITSRRAGRCARRSPPATRCSRPWASEFSRNFNSA